MMSEQSSVDIIRKMRITDFEQAAISHLRYIGELKRERDEVSAALGLDLNRVEWCLRMDDAGWITSTKGWIHEGGSAAITVGEAGAFYIAGLTPPPPSWDTIAPPDLPDLSEYIKIITDE